VNPVRVFIATTAGLVAVQRITEEDPEVNSVVCLAGKAVALPISAAYEAFVRNPTGVIQRQFGHPAYRVDVSAPVDEGYSWQLALFAAHALVKADRLAHPDADAPLTVIATGEVNRDLHVLEVDHMAEKFGDLAAGLTAIGADPSRTVLAVPHGNDEAVTDHVQAAGLADSVRVLAIAHTGELIDHMGLAIKDRSDAPLSTPDAPVPPPTWSRGSRAVLLILLAFMVAAGAGAGGVRYSPQLKSWAAQWIPALKDSEPTKSTTRLQPPDTVVLPTVTKKEAEPEASPPPLPEPAKIVDKKPPPQPVPQTVPQTAPKTVKAPAVAKEPPPKTVPVKVDAPTRDILKPSDRPPKNDVIETARLGNAPKDSVILEILENRAPPGYRCRDVRAGVVEAETEAAPAKGPFAFGPSTMDNLCSVEIKATARDEGLYLFGRYHRWAASRPGQGPPDKIIDLGPRRGNVHWSVDIPDDLRRGASFQVLVFSSWQSFNVPTKLLARIGTKPRSPQARKAVKRLKRRGIALKTSRFRVIPERRAPPPRRPGNQSWLPNTGG